jgi:hypothetical protein
MVPELATKRLELAEGRESFLLRTSSSNDGLFVAVHESAPGHEAGLELETADHDDDDGAELADRGSATSRQIRIALPRRDKLPLGQLRLNTVSTNGFRSYTICPKWEAWLVPFPRSDTKGDALDPKLAFSHSWRRILHPLRLNNGIQPCSRNTTTTISSGGRTRMRPPPAPGDVAAEIRRGARLPTNGPSNHDRGKLVG